MYKIALIPGDGIGPEITHAVQTILKELPLNIEWLPVEIGAHALKSHGELIPPSSLERIKTADATLKGPLETAIGKGHKSLNVTLRQALNLYANQRPVNSYKGYGINKDVHLVIFRENTEDLYAGIEERIDADTVHAIKRITRGASTAIAKAAFDYAKAHHLNKVTAVHKANIMKLSDGLFLEAVQEVASHYPDILYEEVIVDNMCMQLVMAPEQFQVIVTQNLYGDILSDLAAGLVGGLGLVPSGNIGTNTAVFEAVHGTAPLIAGKGIANPIALLMSSAMMLSYLGELKHAQALKDAITLVLEDENKADLTPDLGGSGSTASLVQAICRQLSHIVATSY
jgi:isocitrate dehydrogenase (NAD+)